jgi:hypothetical protein
MLGRGRGTRRAGGRCPDDAFYGHPVRSGFPQPRGDRPAQPLAPNNLAPPSAPPEGVVCYERYIPAPVDETGIQCPGEPAIWKSYTYASNGFGYYTETDNFGGTPFNVRLGYVHQDGQAAIMTMHCNPECIVDTWNGIDFPFGH